MKKILSLLFCFIILFSFASVPCQAAEINGFYSSTMEHRATFYKNVDNVLTPFDYTDKLLVNTGTYLGESCTTLTIPFDTENQIRYVSSFHIENLSASHEYNLKFSVSSSILSSSNGFGVRLIFYNDSGVLKEQMLYEGNFDTLNWKDIDFDFKPDASGLGGYKTKIEFLFSYWGSSAVIYRLSDIIEFTDKDDNSSWFEKIINAIKELPSNFVNGIKGFFDNLGEKFESVGNSITNKFEEVKNAVGQWFIDIGDKLSAKFQEVGNAITIKFQEIGNEFSARFDKFKPRIYEVFDWTFGGLNSDGTIDNLGGEDFGQSIISSGFYIPNGSKYILNISESTIFKFDYFNDFMFDILFIEDGIVVSLFGYSLSDFIAHYPDGFELDSGYTYYFIISNYNFDSFESYFGDFDLDDLCNSVVKVYADEGWLTALVQSILSGLKTLFLPTGEFFENKLEELRVFFDEKFGLFALPFTLFVRLVSLYNDIGVGSGVLHLKDFKMFDTSFLSSQDINLKELITNFSNKVYLDSGVDIYEIYFAFIDAIILFAFVRLIKNKYEKMLGTGAFSMPKDIMQEKKGIGEINDN